MKANLKIYIFTLFSLISFFFHNSIFTFDKLILLYLYNALCYDSIFVKGKLKSFCISISLQYLIV